MELIKYTYIYVPSEFHADQILPKLQAQLLSEDVVSVLVVFYCRMLLMRSEVLRTVVSACSISERRKATYV
jgi:hypothetical protein